MLMADVECRPMSPRRSVEATGYGRWTVGLLDEKSWCNADCGRWTLNFDGWC